jgi:uncharacterized SAM-binding protein YcdF (DUF218 family)
MRRALKWAGIGTATLASVFAAGFVVFANIVTSDPNPLPTHADGIVALTGDSQRIDAATFLLAEGRGKRLLISGVNRMVSRTALERLTPERAAFYNCCIDIGYVALDTIGNADETREWAERKGFGSLIVVTSDYHMPRSLVELGRAMPDVQLIPHPTPSQMNRRWWTSPGTARLLMAEYVKLLPATVRLAASRLFVAPVSATAATPKRTQMRASAAYGLP